MRRYFIQLDYCGEGFYGWQRQPDKPSVQQCLEEHFTLVLGQNVHITGAGRTDTGVHAKNYVAHMDASLGQWTPTQLVAKMNAFLPWQIVLHRMIPVADDAHARFHARSRTYLYYIAQKKDPFIFRKAWYYPVHLDVDRMNLAVKYILGEHDFSSFAKTGSQVNNHICSVEEAVWFTDGHCLVFRIRANRFLRNMVRALGGSLVDVGRGKIQPGHMEQMLMFKNKKQWHTSLPARGLFLSHIEYPQHILTAYS